MCEVYNPFRQYISYDKIKDNISKTSQIIQTDGNMVGCRIKTIQGNYCFFHYWCFLLQEWVWVRH